MIQADEKSKKNNNSARESNNSNEISLDNNNFVLRGCSLRNTDFIIGTCTYTGH
jgi:hypothetical protein